MRSIMLATGKDEGPPGGRPLATCVFVLPYGVTVSVTGAMVVPGVVDEVIVASLCHVPVFLLVTSNGIDTEPPAAGGVVWTRHSEPFGGAGVMFAPLVPSRFSAPQFTPESGSPVPALPRPGPSPGNVWFGPYEYVISSLA